MKKLVVIFVVVSCSLFTRAQEIPAATEQQLENQTDADQIETEDDSYLQQLEQFRKHPVNLNTADESELKELQIITGLQIECLISYRKLFGKLVDIYELQAVPAWDIITIRKLLPFITVTLMTSLKEDFGHRFSAGGHSLLLRISQVLEKAKGFRTTPAARQYPGSPQKIFFRYRYAYKNLLQLGIVGDKDAGEQFFKGAQRKGFDFYSFHVFARKIKSIEALAIGDFTVNMGQGLIQWQSLAFKKSSDVVGIKRQSAVLRPYSSAGEFNFHRGLGITIKKRKIETTLFCSIRNLNANYVADSITKNNFVSSFLTSGYNRTVSELIDRNSLRQMAGGVAVKYTRNKWHIGVNGVYYKFSIRVNKRTDPYNLFAFSGDNWYNGSVDYSYTYRNIHFFGEVAADKILHKAFVNGVLISVDPSVDLAFVNRTIDKGYQAINGNAFTENTSPTNESGWYAGIVIRVNAAWRLNAYGDVYQFPWLKYLVDAPGYGKDFLVQMSYTPNKQVEIYTRYRNETKQENQAGNTTVTNYVVELPKRNWRVQVNYSINKDVTLRNRAEMVWYGKKARAGNSMLTGTAGPSLNGPDNSEKGFLTFFDFLYKPLLKPYLAILRFQYFETDGYNSRLYAYENDVLYSYSIPVFFDKGFRYCITINYDMNKRLSLWLRWGQTIYSDKDVIGSGLDEIGGNKRSEIKFQARYLF